MFKGRIKSFHHFIAGSGQASFNALIPGSWCSALSQIHGGIRRQQVIDFVALVKLKREREREIIIISLKLAKTIYH